MARNMKKANIDFFNNIYIALEDNSIISQIPISTRYFATNAEEKEWLQHITLKYQFRFSKDTNALLLCYSNKQYICLVNIDMDEQVDLSMLSEIDINVGIITFLGSEGFLTSNFSRSSRMTILNEVLYDTNQVEYSGHVWQDVERFFPIVRCFELDLTELDVDICENVNVFYWLLCQVTYISGACNNRYTKLSKDVWEKIIFEGNLANLQYKNLLLAYTALTWDISYLYLYQCLEDRFACQAVRLLHKKLAIDISEQELSHVLYDNLSWQPKDLEGIESIISKISKESVAISLLTPLAKEQKLEKWIYSMRNYIVHETRDALIPLGDNHSWEMAIAGLIYILIEM